MTSLLFITRKFDGRPGGMQAHARALLGALRARPDLAVTACTYGGPAFLLPVFFLRAFFAALTTTADTVLLGDAALSVLLPPLAVLRPRLRRAVIVHGLDLTWRFPGYRSVIRFALRRADRVAAVSRSTAEIAAGLGVEPARVTVIPCPAPVAHEARSPRKPSQLLLLGRLVPRKGTRWFADAVLPLLLPSRPDLTVVIAGDGPERGLIQAAPPVDLRGAVPDAERDRLLGESALLVVPNLHIDGDAEGFGIVCLEAAARGLPVAAARIDGLHDAVVEGVTGCLFQSGCAEDCVRAILHALDARWDAAAMQRVLRERFDPSVIASRFVRDVL